MDQEKEGIFKTVLYHVSSSLELLGLGRHKQWRKNYGLAWSYHLRAKMMLGELDRNYEEFSRWAFPDSIEFSNTMNSYLSFGNDVPRAKLKELYTACHKRMQEIPELELLSR